MIDNERAAQRLAELGHTTRLSIFRQLIKSGKQGLAVGKLQERLNIPNSTLSHHISRLIRANLVVQKRLGRTLFCLPIYSSLDELLDFLQAECCEQPEK